MKHVIIGTAGHVDHGKTTLIQALTGTNTDRLKEEQERGMTIDIGFAALKLPDGTIAGIVDVPGHERFLKNMLAGASGVDVVLLVIAADESVMPQTVEHLDILRLLDVKNGVVALTKCDMVEKEWTDTVEEDVREQLKGTFLAGVPMIRVSAKTGKGIEALKRTLMAAVSRAEVRNAALPFRLPIDRVFVRQGFGTVVTGTLVAGKIRTGDTVEVLPQRLTGRVRGLQIHGQKVSEAEAGSRVAVNLAGIETEAIERGAQLSAPGVLAPTTVLDASLTLLQTTSPLKDRTRVRLHIGTAEIIGRIRLLGNEETLEPGSSTYIQFRGEEEFVCARGDRFVLRLYSPMRTIGGGIVLDSQPSRHRKGDSRTLESLLSKEKGSPADLLETVLLQHPLGLTRRELPSLTHLAEAEIAAALHELHTEQTLAELPGERLFHTAALTSLNARAVTTLENYHAQFPLRPGMPKEEFRTALSKEVDNRAFTALLNFWQQEKQVAVEGVTVRLTTFEVELNERQQSLLTRIEEYYIACGIAAPAIEDVVRNINAPPDAVNALLHVGLTRKKFVRLAEGVYFHTATVETLQKILTDYLQSHESISVAAFRDLTETNRKFALQALEYLDSIRFTRRDGDQRTLQNRV